MAEPIVSIASLVSAIAAIGAVVISTINAFKIRNVHISINSRMDQMLQLRGEASKAEGIAQEKDRMKP